MRVLLSLILFCISVCAKDRPKDILDTLPEKIAGCARAEVHKYGADELGASVTYETEGLLVTVYVYDMGVETVADGVEDKAVQEAFKTAKSDIDVAKAKGMYSKVEAVASAGKKSADTLSAGYRVVRAEGADKDIPMFSEIYVFGARNHIIKYRVSGYVEKEKELRKTLDKLLPEVRAAVLKSGSAKKKEPR